ncbi:MAG: hypothetical protein P1V19_07655, partial [Gimesia sp.]|nr:hypothetical protein [Gimesia sp.]
MMYPVFVLLMMISLLLPAVPVSGCECAQNQHSSAKKSCCCSNPVSEQSQKQKSCCCQSARQRETQPALAKNQIQCQKQSCQCQQMFSQPAIIVSMKSTELTEQLRYRIDSVDQSSELSVRPASTLSIEKPHSVRS